MKKFMNILFVRRSETKDKWWNRLFNVILSISGFLIFVLAIIFTVTISNHAWIVRKPVAFSLEPNFQSFNGVELPCVEDLFAFKRYESGQTYSDSGIKCDGVTISKDESRRYGKLYDDGIQNLRKQFGFDMYSKKCPIHAPGTRLTTEEIECSLKAMKNEEADPAQPEYKEAEKNLARVKTTQSIDFKFMFYDIFLWLVIPIFTLLLWVILWSSIIYRMILFIAFGKEK